MHLHNVDNMVLRIAYPVYRLQRFCSHWSTSGISARKQHWLSVQNQPQYFSRSFCLTASAASVLTTFLLLSQGPQRVNTPLLTSIRKHNTADSDSEGSDKEEEKIKEMPKPTISEKLQKAKAETAWGLFVADAIAMPVHWYYDPSDIKRDYGHWLTGFTAPNSKHPSSILRLSAVDGSGRGSTSGNNALIGNVILHDKLKFWNGSSSSNHYHQGMTAGDNTLNAVMALHELRTMGQVDHDLVKEERDVRGAVLEDYVSFMTTPGSHNDTYAESFHRSFFKDWVGGGKPTKSDELLEFAEKRSKAMMQERPDHQLAVIGSLVPVIPWVIRNAHKSEKESVQSAVDFVKLTHPVPSLIPFVESYSRMLHAVINGKDLKSEVMQVLGHSMLGGPSNRDRILRVADELEKIPKGSEQKLHVYQQMTSTLGSACYIEGALNSLLFLALQFHDDFEGGVLANANCGGENCHRGAALGALLAAAAANRGPGVPDKLKEGLHSLKPEIKKTVEHMNEGF